MMCLCPDGRFTGAIATTGPALEVGAPVYLGEITVSVSEDAGCGEHVFAFLEPNITTIVLDEDSQVIVGLLVDDLLVEVVGCE